MRFLSRGDLRNQACSACSAEYGPPAKRRPPQTRECGIAARHFITCGASLWSVVCAAVYDRSWHERCMEKKTIRPSWPSWRDFWGPEMPQNPHFHTCIRRNKRDMNSPLHIIFTYTKTDGIGYARIATNSVYRWVTNWLWWIMYRPTLWNQLIWALCCVQANPA